MLYTLVAIILYQYIIVTLLTNQVNVDRKDINLPSKLF